MDMDRTREVLDAFKEISDIPRKSRNEEKIANYLVNWGQRNLFTVERDHIGNVLVRVPASNGYKGSDIIAIQGHMDMVCEKTRDSKHDFSRDPLELYIERDWLKARNTSLGADNGIAIAMAMVLATDKDIIHPPLELLFTVDEETGLTGALNLKENWLKANILINIDSEDEGLFTIGCAGGQEGTISLPHKPLNISDFDTGLEIVVSGLSGGHSGVDIHKEKGNAIIILARFLKLLEMEGIGFGIVEIHGGSAHNAIPRDASGKIVTQGENVIKIKDLQNKFLRETSGEFRKTDPNLLLEVLICSIDKKPCKSSVTDLLLSVPHGVLYHSSIVDGLVETSSNLAQVSTMEGCFIITTSQRSSNNSRLREITGKIVAVCNLAGASIKLNKGYPSWEPDFNGEILTEFTQIYKKLFNKEPIIEVIHAGLECGVIGSKYPELKMISVGPTIKNPHSPDERMLVPTINRVYRLLAEYLNF